MRYLWEVVKEIYREDKSLFVSLTLIAIPLAALCIALVTVSIRMFIWAGWSIKVIMILGTMLLVGLISMEFP